MSSYQAGTTSYRMLPTPRAGPMHKTMILLILSLILPLFAPTFFFAREEETFYHSFKVDSGVYQERHNQGTALSKVSSRWNLKWVQEKIPRLFEVVQRLRHKEVSNRTYLSVTTGKNEIVQEILGIKVSTYFKDCCSVYVDLLKMVSACLIFMFCPPLQNTKYHSNFINKIRLGILHTLVIIYLNLLTYLPIDTETLTTGPRFEVSTVRGGVSTCLSVFHYEPCSIFTKIESVRGVIRKFVTAHPDMLFHEPWRTSIHEYAFVSIHPGQLFYESWTISKFNFSKLLLQLHAFFHVLYVEKYPIYYFYMSVQLWSTPLFKYNQVHYAGKYLHYFFCVVVQIWNAAEYSYGFKNDDGLAFNLPVQFYDYRHVQYAEKYSIYFFHILVQVWLDILNDYSHVQCVEKYSIYSFHVPVQFWLGIFNHGLYSGIFYSRHCSLFTKINARTKFVQLLPCISFKSGSQRKLSVSFKFELGTLHSVVSTYLELPLHLSFKVSDHIISFKFGQDTVCKLATTYPNILFLGPRAGDDYNFGFKNDNGPNYTYQTFFHKYIHVLCNEKYSIYFFHVSVQSRFDNVRYKWCLVECHLRQYWSSVKISVKLTRILPCISFRSYVHNQLGFYSPALPLDTGMSDIMAIPTVSLPGKAGTTGKDLSEDEAGHSGTVTTDHVARTKPWSSYKRSTYSGRKSAASGPYSVPRLLPSFRPVGFEEHDELQRASERSIGPIRQRDRGARVTVNNSSGARPITYDEVEEYNPLEEQRLVRWVDDQCCAQCKRGRCSRQDLNSAIRFFFCTVCLFCHCTSTFFAKWSSSKFPPPRVHFFFFSWSPRSIFFLFLEC